MQKLSDVHFPNEKDIPSLKELWHISFGDDYAYINEFFDKAFEPSNTLCINCGDKAVSALYLIDSNVSKNGRLYKAYYIYAVATHPSYRGRGLMGQLLDYADNIAKQRNVSYLFLVPAGDSLYELYGRYGFKTGFFCKEYSVEGKRVAHNYTTTGMDYASYLRCRAENTLNESVVFGEKGFDVFIASDSEDTGYIYMENVGYCIYGKTDDSVTVYELFGDRDIILNEVFRCCGVGSVRVRESVLQGGSPCGMYKSFGNVPKLESAFIGAHGG